MITKTTSDSGSHKPAGTHVLPPGEGFSLDSFKGKLRIRNLSATARATYRGSHATNTKFDGELWANTPNSSAGQEFLQAGRLELQNTSAEASIEVQTEPMA